MTGARVVVADGGGFPGDLRALRATLATLGHEAVVVPVPEACSILRADAAGWVLVDATTLETPAGIELAAAAEQADGAVLVGWHARVDPTVAWRIVRAGAVPWAPSRRLPLPGAGLVGGDGGVVAAQALHADLAGHHDEAWHAILGIRRAGKASHGSAALVGIGAAALGRFRGRAGHPVALDVLTSHLTRHLGPLDGPDFAWWWTMTEQMAFLAAGVTLPPPGRDDAPGALIGAFHAAGVVVRFTARRQWRTATDLFEDLSEDLVGRVPSIRMPIPGRPTDQHVGSAHRLGAPAQRAGGS